MWEWMMDTWGYGGCAVCGVFGLASFILGLIRYLQIKARNLVDLPAAFREVASELGGTCSAPGLFGRHPTLRGTWKGLPVVVDFPLDWWKRLVYDAETMLADPVWLRARFAVPAGVRARVGHLHALEDLARLGVPAAARGDLLGPHVARVVPPDGCDLVVGGGVAEARVPCSWDGAELQAWRVLELIESAGVIVQAVCAAAGRPAADGAPADAAVGGRRVVTFSVQ